MTRWWLVFLLLIAAVAGVWAAQSQHLASAGAVTAAQPSPIPPPAPRQVEVIPAGESGVGHPVFDPHVLIVSVGQKVTFINTAGTYTSFTADNGAFNSDVLSPGATYTWTPRKPGQYTYASFLEPDEQGVIIVNP